MRVATAAQIAALDRRATTEFGIPTAALMERAGASVAQVAHFVLRERGGRRTVALCGKGNNGGDGLVAARHLRRAGVDVAVIIAAGEEEFEGDARSALSAVRDAGIPVSAAPTIDAPTIERALRGTDLIIDALFGTGFRGPARGTAARLIEQANHSGRPILAVDVPSGLDADTGRLNGPCIRAAATVTMAMPKPGLLLYPGAEMCGEISFADIGYPAALRDDPSVRTHLVTPQMVRALLPPRPPDSHKGTYGRTLVIAGSVGFTGAAVLASLGALRVGAGLVTLAVPRAVYPIVASHVVEAMPTPVDDDGEAISASALPRLNELLDISDAVAVGPGLSTQPGVYEVVEGLLRRDRPLVIDADGLNVLAGRAEVLARANAPVVITPHPGELGRLVGTTAAAIQQDRLAAARRAAAEFRCVVVLKGARTIVARADGEAFIISSGNPGMATGGMGDVLTGAIASFIGQGVAPDDAAWTAAYLHGLAADLIAEERGTAGVLASEVADRLPVAIRRIRSGEQPDLLIQLRD